MISTHSTFTLFSLISSHSIWVKLIFTNGCDVSTHVKQSGEDSFIHSPRALYLREDGLQTPVDFYTPWTNNG